MTENYLSGKKRSLKLGVSDHSENLTSLEVIGGVGIGTTNTDKRSLFVVGNTEITGVLTANSYSGDGSGLTGVAATDHVATFDLVVAGISTFHDDVRVTAGGIDVTSGIVSATGLDIGTNGIDVDGQTDLDELVVAGVSTFSKAIDLNAGIDVDGQADLDEVVVAGAATFTSSLKVDGAVDIGTGGLDVDGETQLDELVVAGVSTFTGNIVAATAEFSGNVTIGGTLTVEDKTNVDSIGLITARTGVRVTAGGIDVTAGVSTFSDTVKFNGAVDIGTGGVDIDGQTDLDELIVAGVTTFSNDIHVGTAITIHAGNIHATGIISATKFVGDGSQITNLPGINTEGSSNLTDVNVSGTTTTTQLYVSGIGTAVKLNVSTGGLDVDGQTDLDELVVAGVSTFSGYPSIDADNEIQVGTAIQLGKAGVITATSFVGSGANLTGIAATDHVSTFDLVVAGISTFNDDVRVLAGGVNVTGVSTFNDTLVAGSSSGLHIGDGNAEIKRSSNDLRIDVSGNHDAYVRTNVSGGTGGNIYLQAMPGENSVVANSDSSVDLYYDNVKKFTTTAVGATVYGNFKSTTLHVAGISTLTGDVNFVGSLDNVNVTGVALTAINVKAIGGNYTGVVTASSFSGSGANLTSLNASNLGSGTVPDARFPATLPAISGVNLTNLPTGINTANDSTFKDLSVTGLKVAGISTFNSAVDINAVVDIDGQLDVDELVVAGVATFSTFITVMGNINANGNIIGDNSTTISDVASVTAKALDIGTGGVDIDGQTDLDELVVAGVSTFTAKAVFNTAYPSIDADNEIQVGTAIQLGKAGVVTATTFSGALSGNATSATTATTATNVTVADESSDTSCNVLFTTAATGDLAPKSGSNITFNSSSGALSATSFSGDGSNLTGIGTQGPDGAFNGIVVSGISTFHDDVRITGGGINAVGVITATSFSGSGANLTGVGTQGIDIQARGITATGIATFYNDVKIVGGGSTAGNQITIGATTLNDGTLTFDGTAGQLFSISNNLTDGSIFSVNDVSGMPSIDVGAAGTIQLAPYGAGELVGIGTTRPTSKLDVVGDVQVVGVVTATSFSGSGANLTDLPGATDGSFIGLNVTGITTLGDDVTITAGGLVVSAGVVTATDLDISNDVDIDGTCEADAYTVNGTALDTHIAGVTVTNSTNSAHVYVTDNESTSENNLITFVENAQDSTGNHGLEMDGNFTYNPSSGTVTATVFSGSGASLTSLNASNLGSGTIPSGRYGTGNLLVKARSTSAASDSGSNVFAGPNAGAAFNGSSGDHNTFFGISAGQNNDGGQNNTFLGSNAGNTNVSGHENVAIGQAAFENGTGDQNICIGRAAGDVGSFSGDNNIIIGHDADPTSNSTSNEITFGDSNINKFRIPGLSFTLEPGGANITGVLTATSFSGSGANLTNIPASTDGSFIGLNVTGLSTFVGVATFKGAVLGYGAAGVTTFMNEIHSNKASQIFRFRNDSGATQHGAISVDGSAFSIFTHSSGGSPFKIYQNGWTYVFNTNQHFEVGSGTTINNSGANFIGVVTASSFTGDGSALTNLPASESTGEFYVGFTSSVTMNAASYEATGHTFPSTASKTYTIDSIMASNVANVGIGTTVNLIASISSNSGVAAGTTEQTYFAYNIPIAAGGAIELIKEPIVANPNDIVKLWATDATYTGISSAIQVHMTYTQQDSTDFFGKYAANTSIGSTTIIGIHTAGTTKAATIQSVHITNRSDVGPFPVDIMMTDSTGIVTTYLVKNLVIPKYSSVEILERPKRMETGSSLGVKVQQTGTIDVIVSGKTYS